MNILCSNCGLRYDPAVNNGICPHCGRYNEAPPEARQAAAAPAYDELSPDPAPEELWAPPAPPRRRVSRAALVLLGIFLLAFAAECVAFPLVSSGSRSVQAQAAYVPDAVREAAAQNEAFAFGPGGRQVTVGAAQRLTDLRGVEQGAVAVRVWCETKKMDGYQSAWATDLFLQAGEIYYPALQIYDLESFYPELAAGAMDPYDLQGSAMSEGWLYFVVPGEAAKYTLWFQSQALDRNYDVSEVTMTGVPLAVEEGSVSEG